MVSATLFIYSLLFRMPCTRPISSCFQVPSGGSLIWLQPLFDKFLSALWRIHSSNTSWNDTFLVTLFCMYFMILLFSKIIILSLFVNCSRGTKMGFRIGPNVIDLYKIQFQPNIFQWIFFWKQSLKDINNFHFQFNMIENYINKLIFVVL